MPDQSQQLKTRAIEKMVRQRASQERSPLLDLVLENWRFGMWSAVRKLLGESAEVSWQTSSALRFADYCEAVPPGSVFGVFRIAEWDGQGLIAMDTQLVDAAVEALLGGGHVVNATPARREPTTVDRTIAGRFIRLAIDELARAFLRTDQGLGPVTAKLLKLESDPRLLTAARREEMVTSASFQILLGDRGGRYDLLLPHSMLEAASRKLANAQRSGRLHPEEPEPSPLRAVLPGTPLTLHAVVDRLTLTLADIAQWHEGMVLPLGVDAERPAILYGEKEGGPGLGHQMFIGRLGTSQGRKAVRILEVVPASADSVATEGLP
jgi:flagellar motor switch protein FliM